MKDLNKLCFLPGSLLALKDGKYNYINLLKQGLTNLGVTYPSPAPSASLTSTYIGFGVGGVLSGDSNLVSTGDNLTVKLGGEPYFQAIGGDVFLGQQNGSYTQFNENLIDNFNSSGTEHYFTVDHNSHIAQISLEQQSIFGKRLMLDGANRLYTIGDVEGVNSGNKIQISDVDNLAYYDNTAHTGKMGINTATPYTALQVIGDAEISSPTIAAALIVDAGGVTVIGDANTIGNGTVINIDDPSQTVTVSTLAGTGTRAVLADASGVLSAPISDSTTKRLIKPLTNGLSTLMKFRPVTFQYKKEFENYGKGQQVGFIAQDIQKILPNSVYTNNSNGKMGYNEIDLLPVAISAIQEQQKQIQELSAKVDKLEEQLTINKNK